MCEREVVTDSLPESPHSFREHGQLPLLSDGAQNSQPTEVTLREHYRKKLASCSLVGTSQCSGLCRTMALGEAVQG